MKYRHAQTFHGLDFEARHNANFGRSLWVFRILELSYARDDALDVARFLQSDFESPRGGVRAKFDDLHISLLVTSSDERCVDDASSPISKFCFLRSNTGKITIYGPQAGDRLKDVIEMMRRDVADRIGLRTVSSNEKTENVVLFYFSGHGYTVADSDNPVPYLAMPDNHRPSPIRDLNVIDFLNTINNMPGDKIIILDACRASFQSLDYRRLDSSEAGNYLRVAAAGKYTRGYHLVFSTRTGGLSYEQRVVNSSNMLPGFQLWPTRVDASKRGNGVFTLGFMQALLCTDALSEGQEEPMFPDIKKFLNYTYFSEQNKQYKSIKGALQAGGLRDIERPFMEYFPYSTNTDLSIRKFPSPNNCYSLRQ